MVSVTVSVYIIRDTHTLACRVHAHTNTQHKTSVLVMDFEDCNGL